MRGNIKATQDFIKDLEEERNSLRRQRDEKMDVILGLHARVEKLEKQRQDALIFLMAGEADEETLLAVLKILEQRYD